MKNYLENQILLYVAFVALLILFLGDTKKKLIYIFDQWSKFYFGLDVQILFKS